MQPYQQAFIEVAIANCALRFGQFTLKSGRISPYFFNVGQLNTGLALKMVGECYANAIVQSGWQYDVLFGPAYKGIPLVCASSIALAGKYQLDVPYCFNRKEAKDHGEGGLLIGAPLTGRVLIVDDVITAGTAINEARQLIQSHHASIAGVIVALDRQEKGQGQLSALLELKAKFNLNVQAIITMTDILHYVESNPQLAAHGQKLAAYREQYGVF